MSDSTPSLNHRGIVLDHFLTPERFNLPQIPLDKQGMHIIGHALLVASGLTCFH